MTDSEVSTSEFPPLTNDTIFKVIRGEKCPKTPVWVMRQAGRYLPEFMALRKDNSFFTICQTPELACEATLLPIRRYDLDAAIIFSDILVIPQALGMEVIMEPGVGPVLPHPLKEPDDLKKLQPNDAAARLKYVYEAITLTRKKLQGSVPLFGFSGAPWTLMGYMIEGGGSKTLSKAKKWLYRHPKESHALLATLTDTIADYLVSQVKAGAQILQVFDSSAEYLNRDLYVQFALPYLKKIREDVRKRLGTRDVPMVLFAKGAHFCLKEQTELGYEVLGIDWTVEPDKVLPLIAGKGITLQGNLDPCALYGDEESIGRATKEMLHKFGSAQLIANLGHGIYPDTPVESVKVFVDTIHTATR